MEIVRFPGSVNRDFSILSTKEAVMDKEKYLKKHPEKRQKCEVWTRVMGYHRPVESFNDGKQSEYKERKLFTEQAASRSPHRKD